MIKEGVIKPTNINSSFVFIFYHPVCIFLMFAKVVVTFWSHFIIFQVSRDRETSPKGNFPELLFPDLLRTLQEAL